MTDAPTTAPISLFSSHYVAAIRDYGCGRLRPPSISAVSTANERDTAKCLKRSKNCVARRGGDLVHQFNQSVLCWLGVSFFLRSAA